jgi:hypothetical protein
MTRIINLNSVIGDRSFKFETEAKPAPKAVRRKKIVYQKDLSGRVINQFSSVNQAVEKTGVNREAINACLNGHQRTGKGFRWEYKIVD